MPNRILKESVCTSVTLDQLSADEERLFYRLMVQCDDFGRFYAHPGIVRGHCFPRKTDITLEQLGAWLDSLARAGLITRYMVGDEAYLQMVTWDKHQQVRAKRSKFPPPSTASEQMPAPASKPEQPLTPASNGNHLLAVDSNGNHLQANVPVIQSESESESNPLRAAGAAKNAKTVPKPKPARVPITDQDTEALVKKYRESFGTPQAVRDEIELALNHEARLKNFNERLYVDGWLRREISRRPAQFANARNGRPPERERNTRDRTFEDPLTRRE